jgi:hypothetical protein
MVAGGFLNSQDRTTEFRAWPYRLTGGTSGAGKLREYDEATLELAIADASHHHLRLKRNCGILMEVSATSSQDS